MLIRLARLLRDDAKPWTDLGDKIAGAGPRLGIWTQQEGDIHTSYKGPRSTTMIERIEPSETHKRMYIGL